MLRLGPRLDSYSHISGQLVWNLAYRHYFAPTLTSIQERFYGMTENKREQEMDMREMVEKAKRGEPLYGESQLSDYMQGVAARNSRYSGVFLHMLPWFNFVNHNQVRSRPRLITEIFVFTWHSMASTRQNIINRPSVN